jgi:hypothetical protein
MGSHRGRVAEAALLRDLLDGNLHREVCTLRQPFIPLPRFGVAVDLVPGAVAERGPLEPRPPGVESGGTKEVCGVIALSRGR